MCVEAFVRLGFYPGPQDEHVYVADELNNLCTYWLWSLLVAVPHYYDVRHAVRIHTLEQYHY